MVQLGCLFVALAGVTAAFAVASIAILAYYLPSLPSGVEEHRFDDVYGNGSLMERGRRVLLRLGLVEERMCDRMPGMITVEVEPPEGLPNLGFMHLHPQGTLVLMDARTYTQWSCFALGVVNLPMGSIFRLDVSTEHQVQVQLADLAWLGTQYIKQDIISPCSDEDMACTESWIAAWHEFREGGTLAKMQQLLPVILFGPGYPMLSHVARRQRVIELRKHHYEHHLNRMWAISSAAGKPHWVEKIFEETISLSDGALDHFMRSRVITSICDMLELRLLQDEHVSIFLNIHAELIPTCNTHSIHDHGVSFASTLVFGSFVHNLYVGARGPFESQGETLVNDSFILKAARYERDYMRYLTAGGCDIALHNENSNSTLHIATFAGEQLPYGARKESARDWGVVKLVECSTIDAGTTYMMPFSWVHRPRRPVGFHSTMTVAVFDKVADGGFGEVKLHSNTYNFSLAANAQDFRKALSQIRDFLKEPTPSGLLAIPLGMRDGGIARYVDARLGRTDDDTWY